MAGAVEQNADAEVAHFQATEVHALGVAQHQPGVGRGAHVGAELAGQGAGAGVYSLVLDIAGAVNGDVLAVARPRQAGDLHRAFDFRQGAGRPDDKRGLADCGDVDAVVAGLLVAGFDRPAQGAWLAVVGVAVDPQGFGGRCASDRGQGQQRQQGCQQGHQTHGCRFRKLLFL
ncbi:hypothetical protein D3C79_856080 [compost metagenome]